MRLMRLHVVVGLATCLVVAGCAATARFTGGVPNTKYIDSIGASDFHFPAGAVGQAKDVDLHRAEGAGLVHAPGLTRYVNDVLARLVQQSPVRNVPAVAYVTATDQFGAVTSADANIFVCLGTIQAVGSEPALAAVLAHELAHAIRGHAGTDTIANMQATGVMWTGVALAGQQQLARYGGGGLPGGAGLANAAENQALLLKVSQRVALPSWTRTQEREADLLGLDLLVRAGYDPKAFVDMLDVQLEAEVRETSDESLAASMKTMFQSTAATGSVPSTGAMLTKVGGFFVEKLGRSHPDTKERRDTITQYIARHYPSAAAAKPPASGWGKALGERQTKGILRNYKVAKEARDQLASGNVSGAALSAGESVDGETRDHAFPASILASVRNAQGKPQLAAQAIRPAVSGREPSWLAYQVAGFAQITSGKARDGVDVFEQGYRRLSEPYQAIPYLLLGYQETGRIREAEQLARTCATRYPQLQLAGLCSADVARKEEQKGHGDGDGKRDGKSRGKDDDGDADVDRHVPSRRGWGGGWWPR
jgi:Zn-dependent protease with chaperone function